MKVRVSMPGAYMAVEMDEERAYRMFRKMVELLCITGSVRESAAGMEPMPEFDCEPASETEVEMEPMPEIVNQACVMEEPGEPEESAAPMISIGYGGFLYIKCPDCGKVKGFCAKTRIGNFRCECGNVTKLEHLVPLYMNCECGRNARYLTNMEEPVFDIVCYDCGNPVPVAWNPKKKQYETIRG